MLRFCDSFDHYATSEFTRKYTTVSSTPTIDTTSGVPRTGRGCLEAGGTDRFVTKIVPSASTYIIGFAFKPVSSVDLNFLAFYDGVTWQGFLKYVYSTSAIAWYRGNPSGVLLGTSSSGIIQHNAWNYVEVKITPHPSISADTCVIRINEVIVLNLAAATNTRGSSNSSMDAFSIGTMTGGGNTPSVRFDDLYVCDSTGSDNNDFLGDVRVDVLLPSANGTTNDFTPSAGSNFQAVDDVVSDDDSTYVSSLTPNDIDLYAMGDMSITPVAIKGIQGVLCARKDTAGTRALQHAYRINGTNYFGSSLYPGTDYKYHLDPRDLNPDTSAAWTKTEINAMEAGVKVSA